MCSGSEGDGQDGTDDNDGKGDDKDGKGDGKDGKGDGKDGKGDDNDGKGDDKDGKGDACKSEQSAAEVLGYTQVAWDNVSGKEPQPSAALKYWAELTDKEKAAAG